MSAMTDYLKVEPRKHIFRTGSFTKPSALWIRPYTASPGETGGSYAAGVVRGLSGNASLTPMVVPQALHTAAWVAPIGPNGPIGATNVFTLPGPLRGVQPIGTYQHNIPY